MQPPPPVESVQRTVLLLVGSYGLVAVFVYMVLETSLLLHFVPSEVVLPFAAALLVTDPLSFAVFVLVTTAGSTLGSVVAYYLFGRNSTRVLERYGRYVHVSPADVDRWERWFHRWGESSVFWGRLLPVARALVSVPAGAAGMDLRRFVPLSAAGALVFDATLTSLVYAGERSGPLLQRALEALVGVALVDGAYVRSHPLVVLVAALAVLALVGYLWHDRARIREHPDVVKRRALRAVRATGLLIGLLLVSSAFALPDRAFEAVTWVWNDPLVLTALGLSSAGALLVLGALVVAGSLLVYEVATGLSVRWLARRVRGKRRE